MANEITVTSQVNVAKDNLRRRRNHTGQLDMAGDAVWGPVTKTITTSATQIVPSSEIGTMGEVWAHNLDGTNFVTFGGDNTNLPFKISAGLAHNFEVASGEELWMKADTANCDVDIMIVEA